MGEHATSSTPGGACAVAKKIRGPGLTVELRLHKGAGGGGSSRDGEKEGFFIAVCRNN